MDPAVAAWAAGILEGEGAFAWHKMPRGRLTPRVQLEMTDRDVVERFAAIAGGTVATRTRGNRQEIFRCEIKGDRARALLLAVLPYMGRRRTAQILAILEP